MNRDTCIRWGLPEQITTKGLWWVRCPTPGQGLGLKDAGALEFVMPGCVC